MSQREILAAQRLDAPYHIHAFDYGRYQMLLSQERLDAIIVHRVSWPPERRTHSIDNSVYPGGMVAFTFTALNSAGEDHHILAAKYYALAHLIGHVYGPPVAIAVIDLPACSVLAALLSGTLKLKTETSTVGFMKSITQANYPGMQGAARIYGIPAERQMDLLALGQALL